MTLRHALREIQPKTHEITPWRHPAASSARRPKRGPRTNDRKNIVVRPRPQTPGFEIGGSSTTHHKLWVGSVASEITNPNVFAGLYTLPIHLCLFFYPRGLLEDRFGIAIGRFPGTPATRVRIMTVRNFRSLAGRLRPSPNREIRCSDPVGS